MQHPREWVVRESREAAPQVRSFWLAPEDGAVPAFIPGQFVNIALPQLGVESKSYSIANAPGENSLRIIVKKMGRFSGALCALGEGDTLLVSEPLGFFYPIDEKTPRVFVAGGIGIVPFLSMLRAKSGAGTPTTLFYSARTAEDLIGEEEVRISAASVRIFLTRAQDAGEGVMRRRIEASDLVHDVSPDSHYFLCGGIPFVRDMRLHLKALAIPEECIFTESFF